MNKRKFIAAALLAGAAAATQAAEMVLFENPGFNGRQLTLRGYMPDISSFGFNDRASSAAVRAGTWEVCTDKNFQGFCAILQPGEYRRLDARFNDRISSAREVEPQAAAVAPAQPPVAVVPVQPPVAVVPPAYPERGSIELFGQRGFRGQAITLDRDAPELDAFSFNDRASSLIVSEGRWELCTDAGFRGTCRIFEPGQYAELDARLQNSISSARMLRQRYEPPVVATPAQPPRIVLFDGDNFRGRSLIVSDDLADLRRSDFNNDSASILVESGNWEVCSDAYYRGRCRILSPGEYRRLDSALYRSISSVRPAAVDYGARERPPLAAAELFEGINFGGRSIGIDRDMPNLDRRAFNDRASSMIIHEGQWEICREAGYNGRCNVLGPGRYADLGRLNNEVSSLRRIR